MYARPVVAVVYCPVAFTDDVIDHARETEPEAFILDVFFNAHPICSNSKQKPKAPNALVPTSLAYPGGSVEFLVDMGSEVRLSILHYFLAQPSSLVCYSSHDSKGEFHQTLHGYLWRRCVRASFLTVILCPRRTYTVHSNTSIPHPRPCTFRRSDNTNTQPPLSHPQRTASTSCHSPHVLSQTCQRRLGSPRVSIPPSRFWRLPNRL